MGNVRKAHTKIGQTSAKPAMEYVPEITVAPLRKLHKQYETKIAELTEESNNKRALVEESKMQAIAYLKTMEETANEYLKHMQKHKCGSFSHCGCRIPSC